MTTPLQQTRHPSGAARGEHSFCCTGPHTALHWQHHPIALAALSLDASSIASVQLGGTWQPADTDDAVTIIRMRLQQLPACGLALSKLAPTSSHAGTALGSTLSQAPAESSTIHDARQPPQTNAHQCRFIKMYLSPASPCQGRLQLGSRNREYAYQHASASMRPRGCTEQPIRGALTCWVMEPLAVNPVSCCIWCPVCTRHAPYGSQCLTHSGVKLRGRALLQVAEDWPFFNTSPAPLSRQCTSHAHLDDREASSSEASARCCGSVPSMCPCIRQAPAP